MKFKKRLLHLGNTTTDTFQFAVAANNYYHYYFYYLNTITVEILCTYRTKTVNLTCTVEKKETFDLDLFILI